MKKKSIILIGIAVVACFVVILLFLKMFYTNEEIRLRNLYTAQYDVIEGYHDKMWKTIQQQAEVTDKYQESFRDIYVGIMEGRYSSENGRGELMSWIQESNPQFSVTLFAQLMNTIEVQREAFLKEQTKILNIINQHSNLIETIPGNWFLSGKEKLPYTMITSSRSKEVRETGRDDDVKLF